MLLSMAISLAWLHFLPAMVSWPTISSVEYFVTMLAAFTVIAGYTRQTIAVVGESVPAAVSCVLSVIDRVHTWLIIGGQIRTALTLLTVSNFGKVTGSTGQLPR